MSPTEELAVKLIREAVENFKKRAMNEIMAIDDMTVGGDEARRAIAQQYRIATDVGQTIEVAVTAVKR